MQRPLQIRDAALDDPAEAAAVVELIAEYAAGPGGGFFELDATARAALVPGLRAQPNAFTLLAFDAGEPVGLAVCLWGFSTFAGRPYVNIHDLAVRASRRGQGIGSALLAEVERRACERGCCKLTLEVHDGNPGARRLYERVGFGSGESPTWFLTRTL